MALGSLIFQGASFLTIIILKPYLDEHEFAFFITQISWASIIGSVATLRLELLLFQERGTMDREILFSILLFSVAILAVLGAGINLVLWFIHSPVPLSGMAILLALGFGLIEVQSFLCVQMQQVGELVITRAMQAAALIGTGLFAWSGVKADLFSIYAVGVTVPLIFWFAYAIARAGGAFRLRLPPPAMLKRSASLTLSTLVNTIYANVPVILASATQPAGFVADFGFIMRLLTGPITLIRQAYGHTYLTEAFKVKRELPNQAQALWRLTRAAMARSILTYLIIMIVTTVVLFASHEILQISNPWMVFLLAFVTLGQVGVNTVAMVRTPLQKERAFLLFDILRLSILVGVLTYLSHDDFDVIFSIASSTLYIAYIFFIRHQARVYDAGP